MLQLAESLIHTPPTEDEKADGSSGSMNNCKTFNVRFVTYRSQIDSPRNVPASLLAAHLDSLHNPSHRNPPDIPSDCDPFRVRICFQLICKVGSAEQQAHHDGLPSVHLSMSLRCGGLACATADWSSGSEASDVGSSGAQSSAGNSNPFCSLRTCRNKTFRFTLGRTSLACVVMAFALLG